MNKSKVYTKEEIINLIKEDKVELNYTIEKIADGVFEYREIEYTTVEDLVKLNKEEILEILNNLK